MSIKLKDTPQNKRWWAWIEAVAESVHQSAPTWQYWGEERSELRGPYCSFPRKPTRAPVPVTQEPKRFTSDAYD